MRLQQRCSLKIPTTAHNGADFKFTVRAYGAPTPVARMEIKRPHGTPRPAN